MGRKGKKEERMEEEWWVESKVGRWEMTEKNHRWKNYRNKYKMGERRRLEWKRWKDRKKGGKKGRKKARYKEKNEGK